MPVKSYIVQPLEGKMKELTQSLGKLKSCDIFPALNEDLLVVVTDTEDDHQEEQLVDNLQALPYLKHLTLVSGFNPALA
jgi:nitrate reductase NapAB chaperone NapD